MTEDAWGRVAARLEAAWPSPPMDDARRALYFEVLEPLRDEQVEDAVSALLGEDRDAMPPPGTIKARAEALAGAQVAEPASGDVGNAPLAADTGPTGDELERVKRRPWLGVLLGLIGLFPFAAWLGVRALMDRRDAKAAGRQYPGDTWAAVTALVLAAFSAIWVSALLLVWLTNTDPNAGGYLTRSELEQSIVNDGEFGQGARQLRVLAASCVEDSGNGSRYQCVVDFRGGLSQTYTVTVAEDGTWVAG